MNVCIVSIIIMCVQMVDWNERKGDKSAELEHHGKVVQLINSWFDARSKLRLFVRLNRLHHCLEQPHSSSPFHHSPFFRAQKEFRESNTFLCNLCAFFFFLYFFCGFGNDDRGGKKERIKNRRICRRPRIQLRFLIHHRVSSRDHFHVA